MNGGKRPLSPRFLQSDIADVFTNVIKSMNDQRRVQVWNRDVSKEFRSTSHTPHNNDPDDFSLNSSCINSSPSNMEVKRLTSGNPATSPRFAIKNLKQREIRNTTN